MDLVYRSKSRHGYLHERRKCRVFAVLRSFVPTRLFETSPSVREELEFKLRSLSLQAGAIGQLSVNVLGMRRYSELTTAKVGPRRPRE